MTRNLYKIQKEIAKKRGGKVEALHEKSRDAKRLRRAGAREERLARVAAAISKGRQLYCECASSPCYYYTQDHTRILCSPFPPS